MAKSMNEMYAQSFIFKFTNREGKRIIGDAPMTLSEAQDVFKRGIRNMRPGDVKVFHEVQLSSIPKTNVSYKVNVSTAFIQFCKSRYLDDHQKSSIYKHISDVYNAKNLRYDFLVCKMDNSGKLQMTAIEVNGPQHYFGDGPAFANQISRDIAKLLASHKLGVKLVEIDASNGISHAGYDLIEKELKKFGAKKH